VPAMLWHYQLAGGMGLPLHQRQCRSRRWRPQINPSTGQDAQVGEVVQVEDLEFGSRIADARERASLDLTVVRLRFGCA
jgi:hypothetical protein